MAFIKIKDRVYAKGLCNIDKEVSIIEIVDLYSNTLIDKVRPCSSNCMVTGRILGYLITDLLSNAIIKTNYCPVTGIAEDSVDFHVKYLENNVSLNMGLAHMSSEWFKENTLNPGSFVAGLPEIETLKGRGYRLQAFDLDVANNGKTAHFDAIIDRDIIRVIIDVEDEVYSSKAYSLLDKLRQEEKKVRVDFPYLELGEITDKITYCPMTKEIHISNFIPGLSAKAVLKLDEDSDQKVTWIMNENNNFSLTMDAMNIWNRTFETYLDIAKAILAQY